MVGFVVAKLTFYSLFASADGDLFVFIRKR